MKIIKLMILCTGVLTGFYCASAAEKETIEDKPRMLPSENFQIESIDRGEVDASEDKSVYYKIFINKELAAKTTSGLFYQSKSVKLKLDPGRHHFFAERWVLTESNDSLTPEYKRANNVWQMKPRYIDIQEKNITKLTFGFDHNLNNYYFTIESEK